MQAGKLDRRITVRRAVVTQNAYNEDVETWSDLFTVWASYKPVSDAEQVKAAAVGASITARFQIRWSAQAVSITPLDQLSFEGRAFNITGVKEIGRREGLEISAVARAEPLTP